MQTVIRVALVYLVLMICFRILGKRELGKMSAFDLVTLMLIPELVQQSMVNEDFSFTNAMIGVGTIFTLVFLNSILGHRFPAMESVTQSPPALLVQHGTIIERNMHLERIQPAELFSEMHKAGVDRLEDVKWAILESDGNISIVAEDGVRAAGRRPLEQEAPVAG